MRPESPTPADVPTVEEAARRLHGMDVARERWTNAKTARNWLQRAERHVFPKIGNRPVDVVTPPELRDNILVPLANEHPETGKRVRIILNDVFEFAVESEWRDTNPVERIPAKRLRRPSPEHFESIPWQDVPDGTFPVARV